MLLIDRGSEIYNKIFKSLPKEFETELYSTYSDLKAVFIEIFIRMLLYIINKPMFINGDCNWVNKLNDAIVTYNNNKHTTINTTPVDVKCTFSFKNIISKLKVGYCVRNADKRYIFSKGYSCSWNTELCFKINELLKT